MSEIAKTPEPPYYSVIFPNQRTSHDEEGYQLMAARMMELAAQQSGFLGAESARGEDGFGITVSYWRDVASITAWKQQSEHLQAQRLGKEKWYKSFALRITKVERAYEFEK